MSDLRAPTNSLGWLRIPACGCTAPHSRRLGIAGEYLPGSMGAAEFVGWYNGHPDFAGLDVNLSHERVAVVGNGNVALDIARVLTLPVERLRRTDIADHALETLARSAVREVVVVGRRGPAQAAFTTSELLGLQQNGVRIDVVPADAVRGAQADSAYGNPAQSYAARLKAQTLSEIAQAPPGGGNRRVACPALHRVYEPVDSRMAGHRPGRTRTRRARRPPPGQADRGR